MVYLRFCSSVFVMLLGLAVLWLGAYQFGTPRATFSRDDLDTVAGVAIAGFVIGWVFACVLIEQDRAEAEFALDETNRAWQEWADDLVDDEEIIPDRRQPLQEEQAWEGWMTSQPR